MDMKFPHVYIKVKYLFVISIVFLLSSCQFLKLSENIEIRLPDSPGDLLMNFEYIWILEYRDANGSILSSSINSDRERLNLEVEKGQIQPFIIYAEILGDSADSFETKPAGFIYGFSQISNGVYYFDWNIGFESSLLLSISEYMDPNLINITRLVKVITDAAGSENHWVVDSSVIREQLITGEIRDSDIRRLRQRSIELKIPEGIWYNANLLSTNIKSSDSEIMTAIEISAGYSFFYHSNGSHLEIEMKSDGVYEYIIY